MDWLANPESWIALATLTALEIVLGVDNIIFISILTGKLPVREQGTQSTRRATKIIRCLYFDPS